jgi:ABC-2 type transport system permease protein
MAGLGAGLTTNATTPLSALSSRRLFTTIAWLRWRIFVNSLRGKGAVGELVVKVISYPILALMILGPSFGAGFGAWYFVSHGMDAYLAIPLWIIFVLWQFIGVSTSATGPTFDLDTLTRFPIRYRDYLLMRLSFGLLDPPTLAGICCLVATSIGIAVATPALFPWAATALVIYAICNVLFSRMVYSWLERWLAQRRTRELLTGIILVVSLGFQFASQFIQRFTKGGRHAPHSPWMDHAAHVLITVNWLLPPGLTASSIEHMHSGFPLIASATLGGLLLYTVAFLLILHVRLRAQYLGENLSEAPAAVSQSKRASNKTASTTLASNSRASFSFLPATVAACLIKEVRYLLRSGPKLYVLIMPVFIVFIFSMRTSGLNYAGMARNGMTGMLFAYGCAYTQLIFVSLLYNSLGSDGAGVQFYFMAPLRMRDVMLAKNLLTLGIFAIEIILIYTASAFLTKPTPLDLTAATLAWCLFALFLNMSIGNVRSIVSPKGVDPAKVRSQNVSGLNSFISLVTIAVSVALGSLMVVLCHYLHTSYWIAAGVFLVLAILAFAVYVLVLRQVDSIAAKNVESLTGELSKR